LQAHCQAQTTVKVIEKPFIGLAKELATPTHVSPKGLLGFPDAQNKLFSVSSGQKNAFMVNWLKIDTFTP
jgi:siderophore synthetase component